MSCKPKKWQDILSGLAGWEMPEKDSIRYSVKALKGLGEYDRAGKKAVEIIEELLRVDPKDVYLHSSYGAACTRIGELVEILQVKTVIL